MHRFLLLFFVSLLLSLQTEAKRRGGGNRGRAFEANRPAGIGAQEDAWGDDEDDYNEVESPATQAQPPTSKQPEPTRQIER